MFENLLQRYDAPSHETIEILELHQIAHEFKQEQIYRQALDAYCERYDNMAQQHQREHAAMQNDPDLFGLFWKWRTRS